MARIAYGLCEDVQPELAYAEMVGRVKEIKDYIDMTYEDLRG
jgi:hypothetical protein